MLPTGLNNRWFDVCVGGLQTAERKAALGFLAEYAREPSNYLYVKHRSDINTLDEIKNKANIGIVFVNDCDIKLTDCLSVYIPYND